MSAEYHKIYMSEALKIVHSLMDQYALNGWANNINGDRIPWCTYKALFVGFLVSSAKQIELLLVERILIARPDDKDRACDIHYEKVEARKYYKKGVRAVFIPRGYDDVHGVDFNTLKMMAGYTAENLFIVVDHDDVGECDADDWPSTCPHCQSPARVDFNLLCSNPACKWSR